jgi:predicted nuclease of predicted toxin-antitoxin system
MRNAIA